MAFKFFVTCSHCGKTMHIAGCVSKECRLYSLRSRFARLQNEIRLVEVLIRQTEEEEEEEEEEEVQSNG